MKLILGLRDASVARETDVVLANPGTTELGILKSILYLAFLITLKFQDNFFWLITAEI